ncbi:MAG: SCP2 sterol-binding domain-containing protein [Anaerolineales bacterium]|jgi:putative sterol carrier protein
MAGEFPSEEWLKDLIDYLNTDEEYAKTASKWEGDLIFDIQPEGALKKHIRIYLDLWHGKCRGGQFIPEGEEKNAKFILNAPYGNFVKILKGELDAMQAMMTRKLKVKGNMAYMMRNVPTVLKFVSCAQESTVSVLGE